MTDDDVSALCVADNAGSPDASDRRQQLPRAERTRVLPGRTRPALQQSSTTALVTFRHYLCDVLP